MNPDKERAPAIIQIKPMTHHPIRLFVSTNVELKVFTIAWNLSTANTIKLRYVTETVTHVTEYPVKNVHMLSAISPDIFVPERPVTKGIGHHMSEMMSAAATFASKILLSQGKHGPCFTHNGDDYAVPCEVCDHDDRVIKKRPMPR